MDNDQTARINSIESIETFFVVEIVMNQFKTFSAPLLWLHIT